MIKFLNIIMTIFVVLFSFSLATAEQILKEETVVAKVFSEDILYKQILPDSNLLDREYRKLFQGKPTSKEDFQKLDALKKDLEVSSLARLIRTQIYLHLIDDLGIVATTEEVDAKWKSITQGVDFEEEIKMRKKTMGPLLEALEDVYERGIPPQEAYQKLKQKNIKFSKKQWETNLSYYKKQSRRNNLEKFISQTASDASKPEPGIKEMVLRKKFIERIDKEIKSLNPKVSKYLELKSRGATMEELNSKFGSKFLDRQRDAWMKEKYRSVDFEIYVPYLKTARELVVLQ